MNSSSASEFWTADDPPAVQSINEGSRSPLLITCDHAGRLFPQRLGGLGLTVEDSQRHIAYDIGARELALAVGLALSACVIWQTYSRLVIDCNRPLGSSQSIVAVSDGIIIPGNAALTTPQIADRQRSIFDPYHRCIATELDQRAQAGRVPLLLALHSFTPTLAGTQRPWHAGTLYHRDRRAAGPLLDILRRERDLIIGDNQPYAVGVDTDYTLPVHGEGRGIPHVGLEVRQDLIAERAGRDEWSERLAPAFAELCDILRL